MDVQLTSCLTFFFLSFPPPSNNYSYSNEQGVHSLPKCSSFFRGQQHYRKQEKYFYVHKVNFFLLRLNEDY